MLLSRPFESEMAGVLAITQFRNKGGYGKKVYLPAFTQKQRLALSGCGPVGLRRGIWDAEILSSNLSTPTTRFFRFKSYFLDFLTIYIKRKRKMNEKKLHLLENAKTMVECARILKGINYTNGRVKKEIVDYCFDVYGLDIVSKLAENNKHLCLQCGKEIPAGKKFCNSSCAAKYNNSKRIVSKETKEKISNSVRGHYKESPRNTGWHKNGYEEKHTFVCETCGKIFFSKKLNTRFCSAKCAQTNDETKSKIREKVFERIENGTFSGWKTRNIKSYAELFWEDVLNNNSIPFVREDFSTKRYFLDFLIEKNGKKIDLEIDGKQHKDRKEHDTERDAFLSENGYVVYRVKWNSINSEIGKTRMKEKVDTFLEFYRDL